MFLNAPDTSVMLLVRLQAGVENSDAWARFVRLYGPPLLAWCRAHGLQDADARDVSQDILAQLARTMDRFRYDPSRTFRGWLRAVARSALSNWAEKRKVTHLGSGDSAVNDGLYDLPGREGLLDRIEAAYDSELLDAAMSRVRTRVQAHAWEAFRLMAIDGLDGKQAAERLGIKTGAVYAARSRVQRLIREEVERLDRAV